MKPEYYISAAETPTDLSIAASLFGNRDFKAQFPSATLISAATIASLDIKAARVCTHYGVVRTGPPAYDSLDDAGHRVRRHRRRDGVRRRPVGC